MIKNSLCAFIFIFLCSVTVLGDNAIDISHKDENQLLLLSTLDGTIICAERKSGLVRWKMKNEPVIRVPLKGDNVPLPLFLPNPKDGSLYVLGSGDKEAVKKLPFTIPQLVASSPCRSTDGIIYTGKKLDTWFSVNPQNGTKKIFLSFDSADMSCPREGPDSIFVGRTEYNLVMMDSRKNGKTWNFTFYDYTSYSMDPENVQNYDFIHFTGSSSGRVVTFQRDTDSLLWQLNLDSPVIAMYLLEERGLLNVPFTNVAESTLDQLIDDANQKSHFQFGIEFKTSELKLFPTLYIGEYLYGLYALPSLADQSTATLAFDQRGPLLLEGPSQGDTLPPKKDKYTEGKFKIISNKYSERKFDAEKIWKIDDNNLDEKVLSYIFFGHYKVPKINNYITLQIESKSDVSKIFQNETTVFLENRKSSIAIQTDGNFDPESLKLSCLQFYDTIVDISSFNISYNQIRNLFKISWNIINLVILQQENILIKITIVVLILCVFTMAWHFNKQMKDIQQLSQFSKSCGSHSNSSVTALPEDIGYGTIQIGKIKLNTHEVLGKGCEGTFVFRGEFDSRSVAVKRILPECFNFADREVELLRESDQHENVIRYYCMEQDKQFRYLALELCAATLQEYVEDKFVPENITPMQILYQATCGLHHLHTLNIVHRDIKPNNVLLSMPNFKGQVHAMISDFGLCKKLKLGRSSFSRRSGVIGTDGWIAPEMLTGETRTTCSVDIFSLGCVYYYVLTKGNHPFGDSLHCQANIMTGSYQMNGFENENRLAAFLIERMIDLAPSGRPLTDAILKYPLFWNETKILAFFQDVSDRIEKEDAENYVLKNLEYRGASIIRGDWRVHIDDEVAQDLRKYRNYRGNSVRDLLRALRNKKHHYRELSKQAQKNLGEIPLNFVHYWTSRFPLLLIHTWLAMQCVKKEPIFDDYFDQSYSYPELPSRYCSSSHNNYLNEEGIETNMFFDKNIIEPVNSFKSNDLFHTKTFADKTNKEKIKKYKLEGNINLFNTPLNFNNIWFQDWLISNCTDENAFIKWRQSVCSPEENCQKADAVSAVPTTEDISVFPENMTLEICEFFKKKLAVQKRKFFSSHNFSPKKSRFKKPFTKRFEVNKEETLIWKLPS